MKRGLFLFAVLSLSLISPDSESRIDPMRIITDQVARPDIAIIVDTSSSMNMRKMDGKMPGADCGGFAAVGTAGPPVSNINNIDLYGDGMCTGMERYSSSTFYLQQDCYLNSTSLEAFTVRKAGNDPACNPNTCILPTTTSSSDSISRMYMIKRVLRNILPSLKNSANFSLVTYKQEIQNPTNTSQIKPGYLYYKHEPAFTTEPARPVTIFLSEQELRGLGGWDTGTATPLDSFKWNAADDFSYTLLSKFVPVTISTRPYPEPTVARMDSLYANGQDSTMEKRFTYAGPMFIEASSGITWVYKGSYYTFLEKVPLTSNYIAAAACDATRTDGTPDIICLTATTASGCTYCPAGVSDPSNCRNCPTGNNLDCSGTCLSNPALDQANCRTCPAGNSDPANCRNCSTGNNLDCTGYCRFNTALTYANCRTCPAGNSDPTACRNCPTGNNLDCTGYCRFNTALTQANCRTCPAGNSDPTNCKNCSTGNNLDCTGYCRFNTATTQSNCYVCPAGNSDTTNCRNCPTGNNDDCTLLNHCSLTNPDDPVHCRDCTRTDLNQTTCANSDGSTFWGATQWTTNATWSASHWQSDWQAATGTWSAANWVYDWQAATATWSGSNWVYDWQAATGTWSGSNWVSNWQAATAAWVPQTVSCTQIAAKTYTPLASIESQYYGPQFKKGTDTYVYAHYNTLHTACKENLDNCCPSSCSSSSSYNFSDCPTTAKSCATRTNASTCCCNPTSTSCYCQKNRASSDGMLRVALSVDPDSANPDSLVGPIMSNLNYATNGGLFGWGETPTGKSIQVAHSHFIQKAVGDCNATTPLFTSSLNTAAYPGGTCPYVISGTPVPDTRAGCRPRFVLLLTDGEYDTFGTSVDAGTAAQVLYQDTENSANAWGGKPIKTLVVGLPGLPSTAIAKLARIADFGWDGSDQGDKRLPDCCYTNPSDVTTCDGGKKCPGLYLPQNEKDLINDITKALYKGMEGDYATSQASVMTSEAGLVESDIAIVTSTDYPGWTGHLRAWNISSDPPQLLWDVGKKLADRAVASATWYKYRKMFTGYPSSLTSNLPVPFYKSAVYNQSELEAVWAVASGGQPVPTDFQNMIEWLAGKDGIWPLGPIFRATPATVGPAPSYEVGTHGAFEQDVEISKRGRIIYLPTNTGILHAFRARGINGSVQDTDAGEEVFAYVPPNLLPKIYALYKQSNSTTPTGQSDDPKTFKWILASSPRVEDIPPSGSTTDWKTQLVLAMGPGGEDFVALDVTKPWDFSTTPATIKDTPFTVVAHSQEITGLGAYLGETWSVPALYYRTIGGHLIANASMGSGYSSTASGLCAGGMEGDLYTYFNALWSPSSLIYKCHNRTGKEVPDWAVLADATAAIDTNLSGNREIIATYQADMNGRIRRYSQGDVTTVINILPNPTNPDLDNGDPQNPFYYSPAVYHNTDNHVVTLAAASGSFDEANLPATYRQSTLYMRSELAGTAASVTSHFTCRIDQLCSCSYFGTAVPTSCTGATPIAPTASDQARPVSSPFLLENTLTNQMEAIFLLQAPPSAIPSATGAKCGAGSTWLVRAGSEKVIPAGVPATPQSSLIALAKIEGVRTAGMTVVLGGKDIAITKSGTGGNTASVELVGKNVGFQGLATQAVIVESWREVK